MSGKKLVLSVDQAPGFGDRGHQISLGLFDEDGRGSGVRLYGPKYAGNSKTLVETELYAHERGKIRQYLDEVDGPLTASDEAVQALDEALDRGDPLREALESVLPLLKYKANS